MPQMTIRRSVNLTNTKQNVLQPCNQLKERAATLHCGLSSYSKTFHHDFSHQERHNHHVKKIRHMKHISTSRRWVRNRKRRAIYLTWSVTAAGQVLTTLAEKMGNAVKAGKVKVQSHIYNGNTNTFTFTLGILRLPPKMIYLFLLSGMLLITYILFTVFVTLLHLYEQQGRRCLPRPPRMLTET